MQPLDKVEEAFDELHIDIDQPPLLPQWKDITAFLDTVTQEFNVGQLVHLPSFTLFDAMSAIEIMDPRMDTGITSVQPQYDIHQRLSAEQVLSIMDALVSREMAWISGHSLSQTVFTCIYFHHLQQLNPMPMPTLTSTTDDMIYGIMRAYLLATVKCCHSIWLEMTQGNIYEEEDFTTNLFGLTFDHQNADVMIFNDLDAAIMLLNHLIHQSPSETYKALLNRLETRKSLLFSLVYLSQSEGSHLAQAKRELDRVAELLCQVTPSESPSDAFDQNISRKLTTQTPPRPVQLPEAKVAYQQYSLWIQGLRSICDVLDYSSVTSLMHYFLSFAAKVPYPDAFTRSKLNTLFFHNQRIFGKTPIPSFMLQSIQEIVQPPSWWIHPNHPSGAHLNPAELLNAHDTLKGFLDRVSLVFIEFFKVNCHNRSRQRRLLCKLISEWEILQEEAAGVDEVFHALLEGGDQPYYFSSWAYHLKLMMIETILLLGFELELYGLHEYGMIYWYTQCVLHSRAFLLDRIMSFATERYGLDYLTTQHQLNHAKLKLSEALLKIMMLSPAHHSSICFDDEATRYRQRFKSFAKLASPAHPSYPQYQENMAMIEDDDIDIPTMLDSIRQDLKETKRTLEAVLMVDPVQARMDMCVDHFREDVKNIIRASVANQIRLNQLTLSTPVTMAFKYHPWFTHLN